MLPPVGDVSVGQRQLLALRELVAAVGSRLDLPSVLSTIIGQVCALLRCERASLFMLDDDGELVSMVLVGDAPPIRLRPGQGLAGTVVQSGQSIRLDDAWSDPRFHRATDEATGYRTRSLLAVPLVDGGRIRGVVEALNKVDGVFGDDDEALLLGIGGEIALAVERARHVEELQRQRAALDRRVQELDLLVDIDRAIAGADSEEELLDVVCQRVCDVVRCDGASVSFLDKKTSMLTRRAAVGEGYDQVTGASVAIDAGLCGLALRGHRPVRVDDAGALHESVVAMSTLTPSPLDGSVPGPVMCVPLLASGPGDDMIVGALTVVRLRRPASTAPPFTIDDERLLVLLVNRVASAVQESVRRERLREKQQLETIGHMLAGIVHDFRTPMTVISGYVHLMAVEEDAAERRSQAADALKNTEHVTAMIKDLMAFARGESMALLRTVRVESFARELSIYLQRMLDDSPQVRLSFSCTASGEARFDAVKVQRAVLNLAKNAREALEGDGRAGTVVVAVQDDPTSSPAESDVLFVVDDDGPGLAPAIEQRLFQTFASFGKPGGTGLGLAFVKRIAEDHRGSVSVERSARGGCRFTMRLPRHAST
jgi:signal transduction histidine kinase/putative methionine-R-sulfoxide reductase with GAF domain